MALVQRYNEHIFDSKYFSMSLSTLSLTEAIIIKKPASIRNLESVLLLLSWKVVSSFPMVSEILIDILLATLCPWRRLSLKQNKYQEYFLGGLMQPVRRADKLTTFICQFS